MDWQAFIFSPGANWPTKLEQIARARFNNDHLATEASTAALKHWAENDWEKLKHFKGKSSPSTYLISVYHRFLEDFARQKFGRPRPPQWLVRLGSTWQNIFKKLCLERQNVESIATNLSSDSLPVTQIIEITKRIKAKIPKCGEYTGPFNEASLDDENIHVEGVNQADTQDFENILFVLFNIINNHKINEKLCQYTPPKLGNETKLLLKLLYQDSLSLTKAAAMLHLKEHQARKLHKDTLKLLKKSFTEQSIHLEDLSVLDMEGN